MTAFQILVYVTFFAAGMMLGIAATLLTMKNILKKRGLW